MPSEITIVQMKCGRTARIRQVRQGKPKFNPRSSAPIRGGLSSLASLTNLGGSIQCRLKSFGKIVVFCAQGIEIP